MRTENAKQPNSNLSAGSAKLPVMCCAVCFKDIPENHFIRRKYHDNEHCPHCGNDFFGNKWFSYPMPKDKIQKLRDVLSA